MNIKDLSKPITAKALNERLAKNHGERLKLENFKVADLKRIKEKVDKRVNNLELSESFGKLHENEDYQKNKLISKILSKEIKERSFKESKRQTLRKQEIGDIMDYQKGDKRYDDLSGAAKRYANYDIDKLTSDDLSNNDKKKKNGNLRNGNQKENKVKEKAESEDQRKAAAIALKHKREGTKPKQGTASAEMMNMSKKELEKYASKSESQNKKGKSLTEGEEDKAELIMATKNMVDKITGWMQDTSELRSESLIEIIDTMRDELGQNEAESFKQTIEPALDSLYSSMEEARGTLIDGVNKLTGEEGETMGDDPEAGMDDNDMGSEDELEGGDDDGLEDELDDLEGEEEPEDEFAASDAAAGGGEEAGREKRESIQRSRRLANILTDSPKKK